MANLTGVRANSYGVTTPPDWALYGVYDSINGEWTGHWFSSREEAEAHAPEFKDDEQFGIVSVEDDQYGDADWVEA